jgi:hypothetical protein
MFAVMKTFVTVISASTGRNDFIFNEVSPLVGVAIEEIDATRDQIENTELKLTELAFQGI